jgi:hypothetical protein
MWMYSTCIDAFILVHRPYNLIFSASITKGSKNKPKSNKGLSRALPSPLQHILAFYMSYIALNSEQSAAELIVSCVSKWVVN